MSTKSRLSLIHPNLYALFGHLQPGRQKATFLQDSKSNQSILLSSASFLLLHSPLLSVLQIPLGPGGYFCVSPLNKFLLVSCPPCAKSWRRQSCALYPAQNSLLWFYLSVITSSLVCAALKLMSLKWPPPRSHCSVGLCCSERARRQQFLAVTSLRLSLS